MAVNPITSPAKVVASVVAREALTAADTDAMRALLAHHFEGVTQTQFERDLAEKNWIIRLHRAGCLVGFSTLLLYESQFAGERLTVVYSGDTIVTPEAWGTTALPRAWITAVNELCGRDPGRRCYWLLLTSGFRTYRFLPVFWREFTPRFDDITPPDRQPLLLHLARERFGAQYAPDSGIVRFDNPQRLRGVLQTVPPERMADPHVDYFLKRNPGHASGDELVCLTELAPDNFTPAGRRMVARRSDATGPNHR